jgi:hypothetical protein
VIPLDVDNEDAAQQIVAALEAQYPNTIIKGFYESGVDSSAERIAAQAQALSDYLAVASDPTVLAAISTAKDTLQKSLGLSDSGVKTA